MLVIAIQFWLTVTIYRHPSALLKLNHTQHRNFPRFTCTASNSYFKKIRFGKWSLLDNMMVSFIPKEVLILYCTSYRVGISKMNYV